MYAILHLPTGKVLARGIAPCVDIIRPWPGIFTEAEKVYLFYSKKEAEKYKRAFLTALYCMTSENIEFEYPENPPKFLKKSNKRHTYHLQRHAILCGLDSLDHYPWIVNRETNTIKVSSASEFTVIKV